MLLAVLGLNHKTAPVDVREAFSIPAANVMTGLRHLDDYPEIMEAVILSTCNRTEIYAVLDIDNRPSDGKAELMRFLFDLTGNEADIERYLYFYPGHSCIRHLFDVASSLDSLIVGEGQILSQVKKAYAMARESGATSTVLNTLFHRAVATGKRVRTETHIAYSPVSVSYAAVDLARTVLGGDLSGCSALIYGAGQMAELTIKNLFGKGIGQIYVANRHIERAQALVDKLGGMAVSFESAVNQMSEVDIVVTSTGAPHYVVRPWETQQTMARRHGRPLVFIDIAVPRDVDPDVAQIKGVKLYNIDDLKAVVEDNIKRRSEEALQAADIIEEEVESIQNRFKYLSCQPLMVLLSERAERIRRREVKRAMRKLEHVDLGQQRAINHMTRMIVRKILREPMRRLANVAGTQQEEFYVEAIQKLFKLDILEDSEHEK